MYDLPSTPNVSKVVVDGSVVSGENSPFVMYEVGEKQLAASD
jgi:ATP-dependent Clp protease ATP-binding subunit ClpX